MASSLCFPPADPTLPVPSLGGRAPLSVLRGPGSPRPCEWEPGCMVVTGFLACSVWSRARAHSSQEATCALTATATGQRFWFVF